MLIGRELFDGKSCKPGPYSGSPVATGVFSGLKYQTAAEIRGVFFSAPAQNAIDQLASACVQVWPCSRRPRDRNRAGPVRRPCHAQAHAQHADVAIQPLPDYRRPHVQRRETRIDFGAGLRQRALPFHPAVTLNRVAPNCQSSATRAPSIAWVAASVESFVRRPKPAAPCSVKPSRSSCNACTPSIRGQRARPTRTGDRPAGRTCA